MALCTEPQRLRIAIHGAVQGVGFRPFTYRLAIELGLYGYVLNTGQGVTIEVEGPGDLCQAFLRRVEREHPPLAAICSMESTWLDEAGYASFEIRQSVSSRINSAVILPDIATCPDCLREVFDPADRRHRYPFTNCTRCGPRFSIVLSLPYDRANTTMRAFHMCAECAAEYGNPADRRFHAQPNACPTCGPQLALWNREGRAMAREQDALAGAVRHLSAGGILALKGIGGFQLMVLADNPEAIQRLRAAKQRPEKPFAVMVPNSETLQSLCQVSSTEERLLRSSQAPIVLLRSRASGSAIKIAPQVAPGNPCIGVMLPYSPLHHLLLRDLARPVVATSGNLKDEPICTDEYEALARLKDVAELFLVHNRPIARPIDDSVAQIAAGREMILRRARGYAPLPIPVREHVLEGHEEPLLPVLGVGAHLKNTVALLNGSHVFLSQHIGNLDTDLACDTFETAARDLPSLYRAHPTILVADKHPEYASRRWAEVESRREPTLRQFSVQHHLAHITACMAENELRGPVLGVAWDGTGLGDDNTLWGGEFFLVTPPQFQRVATFRGFPLPGGERAAQEPRRCALGCTFAAYGAFALQRLPVTTRSAFERDEGETLLHMLERKVNSPVTSSVGRLFDAVASILDLRQRSTFEGQAAMNVEFSARNSGNQARYPFEFRAASPLELNWMPMLEAILMETGEGVPAPDIAAAFHNTLAQVVLEMARTTGCDRVALGGGCWQNRLLLEKTLAVLEAAGIRCYWPQRVPPNDGGIALGQVAAVAMGCV